MENKFAFSSLLVKVQKEFSRRVNPRKVKSINGSLPFIVLVVGGVFYLKQFAQLRFDYAQQPKLKEVIKREIGIDAQVKDVTLEEEYEKIKDLANEEWENVRIPRPYEEKFNN